MHWGKCLATVKAFTLVSSTFVFLCHDNSCLALVAELIVEYNIKFPMNTRLVSGFYPFCWSFQKQPYSLKETFPQIFNPRYIIQGCDFSYFYRISYFLLLERHPNTVRFVQICPPPQKKIEVQALWRGEIQMLCWVQLGFPTFFWSLESLIITCSKKVHIAGAVALGTPLVIGQRLPASHPCQAIMTFL